MAWNGSDYPEVPPLWNRILKRDSKWHHEMLLFQELKPSLQPTLVGWHLHELAARSTLASPSLHKPENKFDRQKTLYLVLLVQDWSGDVEYASNCLLESLYNFKRVGPDEVLLVSENIMLNIAECLGKHSAEGHIQLKDPAKLFFVENTLKTSILKYGESMIQDISEAYIGVLQRQPLVDSVRNICSIRMESGDRKTVFRVFKRKGWNASHLKEEFTTDELGQLWVTSWKLLEKQRQTWS